MSEPLLIILYRVIVNMFFPLAALCFLKYAYSFLQRMQINLTNPAYLGTFQKTSVVFVCKILLRFHISNVLFILLQNHLILVSCELFKVDILVICSMYCFLSLIMF